MLRRLKSLFIAALFICAPVALRADAQAPPALAEPPANSQVWSIVSTAGRHGEERIWQGADGAVYARQSLNLRGFTTEIDQRMRLDAQGHIESLVVRGTTPEGPADESFRIENGRAHWRSAVDSGDGAPGAFYVPLGGATNAPAALVAALIADSDHAMDIFPSGRARVERLTELTVTANGQSRNLTAWALYGLAWYPAIYWFDDQNRYFAYVDWLSWMPAGWESVEPQLTAAQNAALAARAPRLVAEIGRRPAVPVVFQNVRLFDSEAGVFRDGMSVVVEGDRIAAVGPAASTPAPRHAEIIQGEGRTLLPGLWDNHQHFSDDSAGPLLLALGITSTRNPGNRQEDLVERIRRINAGELLGPRVLPSLLIDGAGPYSAQSGAIARNLEEALAHVRWAHANGYVGVKLYGSLDRRLVAPIAREAHRLGLRVSGHVPAGMRPLDAVRAGYDEITHFNFFMMQAMPADVVSRSNTVERMMGPARYAADVDFTRAPMRPLIDEMIRRNVAVDPTIVVFEAVLLPEQGELAPAYSAYEGALPSQIERQFRRGGLALPEGLTRERVRQSFARFQAGVMELHRRGVPIIAGTDGAGLELIRELELYVDAGMTPAQALQTATITPARVIGWADRTGAITQGRLAELVLVEGDPSRRIGDLRNVEYVMR
ncbi:MAG: amidohydrolase family protein, partial [Hyphomonadaceae bacterium]